MSLGNASLASCSRTGKGWRDGERGKGWGGEKTLTKTQRINNQLSPLGRVSPHVCWIQTTVPVWIHLSVSQTKERGGKNRGSREEKRGRQSQEASLKNPPWVLGFCPSSRWAIVCLSVHACFAYVVYKCRVGCVCARVHMRARIGFQHRKHSLFKK